MRPVQRFVAGVSALPRFTAAGKLVTIGLCLLVAVMSLAGLIENSATLLRHHAVPGVVTSCRGAGPRTEVCTVAYVLGGQRRAAEIDASAAAPRHGEQVELWATGGGVRMAGMAFVHDTLFTAGVLGGCLIVLAGLFTVISRAGEPDAWWRPVAGTLDGPPGRSA